MGMVNVYGELIMEEFKEMTYHTRHERNKVLKQMEVIGAQLNKARKEVLHEKIDAADFKIMKVESEKEINVLENKMI